MYFYIDESGQTGLNLFDNAQPYLCYGVLSSETDLDNLALKTIQDLRKRLNVERLHATELGNERLLEIVDDIIELQNKFNINFDFYRVFKLDHALISFFDQVFDQNVNPAIPRTAYSSPLRYILLISLSDLFDVDLLKKAWESRITANSQNAEGILVEVCKIVLQRVDTLSDARKREIIRDGLLWTIRNPSKISYNVDSKKDTLQISPNLIGFQLVMHGIAKRLKDSNSKATKIIVDRQTQFNNAQTYIANLYNQKGRDVSLISGVGLPVMDLKHMPNVPITCIPGTNSVGLELVDIFLWIFSRSFEGKELAPKLDKVIKDQAHRGLYNEISLAALDNCWSKYFRDLPEVSAKQLDEANKLIERDEARRKKHL